MLPVISIVGSYYDPALHRFTEMGIDLRHGNASDSLQFPTSVPVVALYVVVDKSQRDQHHPEPGQSVQGNNHRTENREHLQVYKRNYGK